MENEEALRRYKEKLELISYYRSPLYEFQDFLRLSVILRKLLLMDEPVTGLDPLATQDLYELVRHLNQDGVTIIMVTHDIENAVQEGKHILHLAGRELYYGPANGYLQTSAAQSLLGGAHHV